MRESIAAIIASVEPQVTTRFVSGSASIPLNVFARRAIASRNSRAPQVIEYWLYPPSSARFAAAVSCEGGSKSGTPWAKFPASWSAAMRVISRITDSGNFCTRSATRLSRITMSSRTAELDFGMGFPGRGRSGRAKTCRANINGAQSHPRYEVATMAERFFDFWRVDVFTDTPLTRNPLAVFPRAAGLSAGEMGGIAREMNLSETTFVFPSTNPTASYRNPIFTPGGEIPFAGHPSIGTAFVAAMEGLVPHPDGSSVVYQELEIGVLPLELICEAGQVKKVIMTQGEPSLGTEVKNVEPLASALGVRAKDLGPKGLVPQIAATGIQSLQVPFRSVDVVKGLDPDLRSLGKVLSKFGEKVVCYAFALGGEMPGAAVHARSFVPDLRIEHPATGSAAGACGAYLAFRGQLPAPPFVIEQGIEIHRASRIEGSVETEDGKPRGVRVGGQYVPLIRGDLRLP